MVQLETGDAVRAAHHQIGNSLQSIASLLSLQGREAGPPAGSVLMDASRRVGVIMRLHQRLQTSSGDKVCLDMLLSDVCRDVCELCETGQDVTVRLDFKPMLASSAVGSALGLIAAELLGNALEHAFTERPGTIVLNLDPTERGLEFSVKDDGRGAHPIKALAPGFGLTLVAKLTTQIHGTMVKTSSETGTSYVLRSPGAWPDLDGPSA